jgi:hypothetical protein
MLNVNPRLRKDVEAMKALASLPPAARRNQLAALTPVIVSSEDLENERLAKTFNGLDQQSIMTLHPTVMLSSMEGVDDQTKASLLALHETMQETARQSVMEQRRAHAGRELHGILQQVFAHYRNESNVLGPSTIVGRRHRRHAQLSQQGKKIAHPTVMVPTMLEVMDAMADERMHFETVTEQTGDATHMLEHLARQLQWLVAELGAAKERGELYEHQYKLTLVDYGHQTERLHALQGQYNDLTLQFSDQGSALQAERSRSADMAREAAMQIDALRDNLKDAMEANLALHMNGGGGGPRGGAGGRSSLPPLRTARGSSKTGALAALGLSVPSSTPPAQSRNASHNTTPRVPAVGGASGISPRDASAAAMSPRPALPTAAVAVGGGGIGIDEKERYLNMINTLRKDLDVQRQLCDEANDALRAALAQVDGERERVVIAEKAGAMELQATQQLLKTVRDGHVRQLDTLEKSLGEAHATAAAHERTIQALQHRLKDSSARLLSLQSLLLSGPSVQTLLMTSAATSKVEAEDASETLGDLADRIAAFTDQFNTMSADDFTTAKARMQTLLHDPPADDGRVGSDAEGHDSLGAIVPSPTSYEVAGLMSGEGVSGAVDNASAVASSQSGLAAPAPLRHRRKPGSSVSTSDQFAQTDEVQWMTHDTRFVHDGHVTTVPSSTTASAAKTRSGAGARSGSSTSKPLSRKGSAVGGGGVGGMGNFASEQIAVSVAGGDVDMSNPSSPFATQLDLAPDRRSPSDQQVPSSRVSPSNNALLPPSAKTLSKSPTTGKSAPAKGAPAKAAKGSKTSGQPSRSPSLRRVGSAASMAEESITVNDDDEEIAAEEEAQKRARKAEQDAMKKAAAGMKSGGISSTNFDMNSNTTSEIAANLDRMTALRKQISQAGDQIHQLQQQVDREKRSSSDLERRLDEQGKAHSKDAEKIASLSKQLDQERSKVEKMSQRISTLLSDITDCQENIQQVKDERDQLQDSLMQRIETLERTIEKYKKADERSAMINKERQFLEVCERAIRCLMSAEATSSCNLCLSRLSNPVSITPCGHVCCEQCFLLHQAEHNISLPSDAYDALQTIYVYRQALVDFHEATERAQADFLAGLIPLPPDAKRPPRPPNGYLTKSTFTKALTGCAFRCPECDKNIGNGYCHQYRFEELCSRLEYVSSVVGELQQMGKARYAEEIQLSDPTAEIQLERLVVADRSKKSEKKTYVDLEATPPTSGSDNDDG